MAQIVPAFAVRSSFGISIIDGPPRYEASSSFIPETSKGCRTMVFSPNGKYFAWVNSIS